MCVFRTIRDTHGYFADVSFMSYTLIELTGRPALMNLYVNDDVENPPHHRAGNRVSPRAAYIHRFRVGRTGTTNNVIHCHFITSICDWISLTVAGCALLVCVAVLLPPPSLDRFLCAVLRCALLFGICALGNSICAYKILCALYFASVSRTRAFPVRAEAHHYKYYYILYGGLWIRGETCGTRDDDGRNIVEHICDGSTGRAQCPRDKYN